MKLIFLIVMMASLSACQTAGELQNAYSKGLANSYSCEQINAAFSAYEADKSSLTALKSIAAMSGYKIEDNPKKETSSYYDSIKSAASVVLAVQGCPAIM